MKNNKGFTLIELLAMLVVLAILMAVTVPNITGIMTNQKNNMYKSDAVKMVESAKTKIAKATYMEKPAANQCIIFSLDYLNSNDDITKGPNGGEYLPYESFVAYTRVGNRYKYYVRLIEEAESGDGGYGYILDDIDQIKNDISLLKTIQGTDMLGMVDDKSTNLATLQGTGGARIRTQCPTVVKFY